MGREHLQAYLNEYTFRFNRRNAEDPGFLFNRLMEYAVLTYGDLTNHLVPGRSIAGDPSAGTGKRPSAVR